MATTKQPSKARCPECSRSVGVAVGIDVYKHGLACLHYQNEGVERVLGRYRGQDDERSRRIVALLEPLAAAEG